MPAGRGYVFLVFQIRPLLNKPMPDTCTENGGANKS